MEQYNQPATYADIRIINGDPRSGKTETGVAFPVDDYYGQMTGIVSSNGELIKARALNKNDKSFLRRYGIPYNKIHYAWVFSDDGKQSKLIRIPKDYMVISPVHIFANFHLYGVKYAYIDLAKIIEHINTDLFSDSWVLSDESVMTDARNSMENAGKLSAAFGATIGKRNIHMCLMVQYNEMLERRYRLMHTMRVICTYDEDTKRINLDINDRGERFSTDYYAPTYWSFFNTKELPQVPQYKIDRALTVMNQANAYATVR